MPNLKKRAHYTWTDGRNSCAPLVVAPLNKSRDSFGLVCKALYDCMIYGWLEGPSYRRVTNISENEIVLDLNKYALTSKLADFEIDPGEEDADMPVRFPAGYATLKLHKTKIGTRLIFGGTQVATTPISVPIASSLKLLIPVVDKVWMGLSLIYTGSRRT